MPSIWESQSFFSTSDVIIIGCGLTGLITSIHLKKQKPNLSVRILEKGLFPEGASVRNAGFACFGSVSEILNDIESEGELTAFNRVAERYEGLKLLEEILKGCDFGQEYNGGHEVFDASGSQLLQDCVNACDYINDQLKYVLGDQAFYISKNTYGIKGANSVISTNKEYSIDSGKLIVQLMSKARSIGVEIHFGCTVEGFERNNDVWGVNCGETTFNARKLVLATNGFSNKLAGTSEIIPGRGQVLLTYPVADLKIKGNFHFHQGYYYFRNYKGAVLLGGGRHLDRENEVTTSQEISNYIQDNLEKVLSEVLLPGNSCKIKQRWAGTMAFGPNNVKTPIVKELKEGLYIGARLGGMGVAISSGVSRQLAHLILTSP